MEFDTPDNEESAADSGLPYGVSERKKRAQYRKVWWTFVSSVLPGAILFLVTVYFVLDISWNLPAQLTPAQLAERTWVDQWVPGILGSLFGVGVLLYLKGGIAEFCETLRDYAEIPVISELELPVSRMARVRDATPLSKVKPLIDSAGLIQIFQEYDLIPKDHSWHLFLEQMKKANQEEPYLFDFLAALADYVEGEPVIDGEIVKIGRLECPGFLRIWMKTEEEPEMYRSLVQELAGISGGKLNVEVLDVRHFDDTGREDGIGTTGRMQFVVNGKPHDWRYDVVGRWVHSEFLLRFGALLRSADAKHVLVQLPCDEMIYILRLPRERIAQFLEEIGGLQVVDILDQQVVDGPFTARG